MQSSAATAAVKYHPVDATNREKKMAEKTLIAYETKSGATKETGRKIDEVLRPKFQREIGTVYLKVQNVS